MLEQVMMASVYSAEYDRFSQGSATIVTECDQGERVWVKSYGNSVAYGHATDIKYNLFTGYVLEYY